MTTAYDVASMFLRALGAPDTTNMRRAVAIWLRFETGGTIIGNNPWNLHSGTACPQSQGYCPGNGSLPGQIGNRYAGPGDRNVAVFATLNDGVKASANNLIRLSPSYGYDDVIREARQGDALGFLRALQNSSWSAGHYGYSKLVNAFASAFNYNTTLTLRSVGGSGGGGGDTAPPPSGDLGAWGDLVKFPVGHILTADDVNTIMRILTDNGFFEGDSVLGGTASKVREILMSKVGREWNKALQEELQADFGAAATEAGTDPLKRIADAFGGLIGVFAFLLDAQNWLYIFALTGGVVLSAYGFSQLTGARIPKPGLPGPAGMVEDAIESEAA